MAIFQATRGLFIVQLLTIHLAWGRHKLLRRRIAFLKVDASGRVKDKGDANLFLEPFRPKTLC